ncbi:MAG: metalloregulator ArsR/SmtB family transcription factor [Tistlia sp.]|uniref:ArsR/SmtB family transcription factor n=1 Tax=Tistlia sp. TaxID=3057121 RepID=UPI0034A45787
METRQAARCLETLGHPTRLEAFRLLVKAGPEGLPVGEVQAHLDVPGSTLSHHIALLVRAGLVEQRREGRVLRCVAGFRLMNELVGFLADECCRGIAAPAPRREAG